MRRRSGPNPSLRRLEISPATISRAIFHQHRNTRLSLLSGTRRRNTLHHKRRAVGVMRRRSGSRSIRRSCAIEDRRVERPNFVVGVMAVRVAVETTVEVAAVAVRVAVETTVEVAAATVVAVADHITVGTGRSSSENSSLVWPGGAK